MGPDQRGIIQFLTNYQSSTGERILRVTTIGREWVFIKFSTRNSHLFPGKFWPQQMGRHPDQKQRHRSKFRPGSRRSSHGSYRRLQSGNWRGFRRITMVRQNADQISREIRRLHQRRSQQLSTFSQFFTLPTVHVSLEKISFLASVELFARRDCFLQVIWRSTTV